MLGCKGLIAKIKNKIPERFNPLKNLPLSLIIPDSFFLKLQSPHIYRSNLPAYYASGFSVFKTYLTTGCKESLLDNSLSFLSRAKQIH